MKRFNYYRFLRILACLIIILILIYHMIFDYYDNIERNNNNLVQNIISEFFYNEERIKNIIKEQEEAYNNCLIEEYSSFDNSSLIEDKIYELNNYFNKYRVSIYYLDPKLGFTYKYNGSKVYYAASTIKMLDALYIYTKADEGLLDLDKELRYSSINRVGESIVLDKVKMGTMIKIRDLVKYAIMHSDNTSHNMLVSYIGKSNLSEYGKLLGAQLTLNSRDNFGSINVNDSMAYLKSLYKYFNTNSNNAKELYSYFINSDQNYLTIGDYKAAVKYGEYNNYYHENGIVYSNHPYLVSILSLHGNNETVIRDINERINELNELFYKNRNDLCYNKVYKKSAG